MTESAARSPAPTPTEAVALRDLGTYFLRLGTFGFGGPVALAGFMHRDLVERRRWLSEDEYELALALAQVMPGPLAAQLAMAIGYFKAGFFGATVVALCFIVPSFLMVLALSVAYVNAQGLSWVQAVFYTVGASVSAIIAIAAYKLARGTNRADPLRWGIFVALFAATIWAQAELAELFLAAGVLMVIVRAKPGWLRLPRPPDGAAVLLPVLPGPLQTSPSSELLVELFIFFAKAGAFVFGSGLAIVPFLHQGVVQQTGWLTERQFLDAVAVALITPGPVVITVAFIGYLVAGLPGATAAALGIFFPVFLFTVVPAPWFQRNRDNPQLRAFAAGATAAATGAIAGAVVILGQRAITDLTTVVVALVSLALLWRFRISEPLLVLVAGVAGILIYSPR